MEVYEDGAQVVWKPVETNTPVHYTVQCKSEGKVWNAALPPCREHLDLCELFTSWIFYFYAETA